MSFLQNISRWLITEQGRRASYVAGGALATGMMVGHYVPHTLLLDKYKEIVRLYRKGISVPLTNKLQERFQKALDIVGVAVEDHKLYQPFHVYGFDIMSAGHSESRFGVIVGLPINFQYESVDSAVEKPNVTIVDKKLDWNSDIGKKFLESLILSENAQIYAIGKEIEMRKSWKVYYDTFYGTTSAMLFYSATSSINDKFNLFRLSRQVRVGMYALVAAFCAMTYFLMKDMTTVYLEQKIDQDLITRNPVFLEGGREFYTKIIERNKVLREILGKQGEKIYTVLGNENHLLRTPHMPFVQRKAFFDEALSASSS